MGSCCSSVGEFAFSDESIKLRDTESYVSYTSDTDTESSDSEHPTEEIMQTPALPYHETLSSEEYDQILNGWHRAIELGNDTLAAYYCNEYTEFDFINKVFPNGDSALIIAARKKYGKLLLFLLTKGAVNDMNDHTGDTALHEAVRNRDERVCYVLIHWQADARATNNNSESPVSIALKYKRTDILDIILPPEQLNDVQFVTDTNSKRVKKIAWSMRNVVSVDNLTSDEYTDEEKKQLDSVRIQMNNPWTKLGRINSLAATKMIQDIQDIELPKLQDWILKLNGVKLFERYERRWLIVKGSHILWSLNEKYIQDDSNHKARREFDDCIDFVAIHEVVNVVHSKRKFIIRARDVESDDRNEKREYKFKCVDKSQRDKWVKGLRLHMEQVAELMEYLGR